jgi:two-component system NarL family sensor kinase
MSASRPAVLRWIAGALLVVAAVAGLAVSAAEHSAGLGDWGVLALLFVLVGSPGTVGVLVLRRHPRHVIGWLLLADAALVGVGVATPNKPGSTAFSIGFFQATQGMWVGFYVGLVMIAYVVPAGHFLSDRWRRWVIFCLAGYVAFVVGSALDAERYRALHTHIPDPLPTLPQWLANVMDVGGIAVVAASLVGCVVCVVTRMRRSSGDERLQMLWFTGGTAVIPLMLGVCLLDGLINGTDGTLTLVAIAVMGSFLPLAIGLAILRYRLWDVELIVSRALTYAALTVAVVGSYGFVLWSTVRLLGNRPLSELLGVGLVAVLVQPVHGFLRRRIERWVYGDRSEPVTAIRRMSQRVEQADDPGLVVRAVTDAVAEAVRATEVWVELVWEGAGPRPGDRVIRVPLTHRGERLGDLAVELPRGRELTSSDMALLHDLARNASTVVIAARLAADLQRSRAQLVAAREEERRRLRRDLHDGLGPSLAAIVLKLNTAEAHGDDVRRLQLLAEARQQTRSAIAEVRRLVDGLRPPAIDEVGLVGAIRQAAASLCSSALTIEVSGPAVMPTLPAAVEVAAFRIASEAMTNVERHAGASRCHVRVAANGAFELSVSDDGRGAPADTSPGVGWTSMSDRAAELGGTCTITGRAGGGTVVRAVLPLPVTRPESAAVPS